MQYVASKYVMWYYMCWSRRKAFKKEDSISPRVSTDTSKKKTNFSNAMWPLKPENETNEETNQLSLWWSPLVVLGSTLAGWHGDCVHRIGWRHKVLSPVLTLTARCSRLLAIHHTKSSQRERESIRLGWKRTKQPLLLHHTCEVMGTQHVKSWATMPPLFFLANRKAFSSTPS